MRLISPFIIASCVMMLPGMLAAHHTFSAEFDRTKPLRVAGAVTRIDWTNPHVYVYIDERDEVSNTTVTWTMELPSPNHLARHGWTRRASQVGERVTVDGFRAKDGSRTGNASTIFDSSGKRLFTAPSPFLPNED